jgi:hypothetical protein
MKPKIPQPLKSEHEELRATSPGNKGGWRIRGQACPE